MIDYTFPRLILVIERFVSASRSVQQEKANRIRLSDGILEVDLMNGVKESRQGVDVQEFKYEKEIII